VQGQGEIQKIISTRKAYTNFIYNRGFICERFHGRMVGGRGLLFELLFVTICEIEQKMGGKDLE
jgi:hypothetical protein